MSKTTSATMMKTSELAIRWKISEQCLRQWRCDSKGPPYVKMGDDRCSRILYRLSDIEKFEKSNSFG